MSKAGRPRGAPSGSSAAVNKVAALLRAQLARSGMSVRALCASFTAEQFDRDIPSHATVQRRLNGADLAGDFSLIAAIVANCTPADEAEGVRQEISDIFAEARSKSPVPENPLRSEVSKLQKKLARLQRQLDKRKDELLEERKLRAEGERKLADSRAELARALVARDTDETRGPGPAVLAVLEEMLLVVRRERDEFAQALRNARPPLVEPHTSVSPPKLESPQRDFVEGEDIDAMERALGRLDPDGGRFGATLRRSFDLQMDGQRTGRYRWDQLSKVDKTSIGHRVEIELRKEFDFGDGPLLDFMLDGIEFECLFSVRGAWMIPPEALGRPCLLVSANDSESTWSVGLIRPEPHLLAAAMNRDGKRLLSKEGKSAVRWLFQDAALPPNLLAHLNEEDAAAIFSPKTGQARIDELFRRIQCTSIDPVTVSTVVMHEDGARRARDARERLRKEGILVLASAEEHRDLARKLELPVPERGQWVSARIAPLVDEDEDLPFFEVDGRKWALAGPGDPIVEIPRSV